MYNSNDDTFDDDERDVSRVSRRKRKIPKISNLLPIEKLGQLEEVKALNLSESDVRGMVDDFEIPRFKRGGKSFIDKEIFLIELEINQQDESFNFLSSKEKKRKSHLATHILSQSCIKYVLMEDLRETQEEKSDDSKKDTSTVIDRVLEIHTNTVLQYFESGRINKSLYEALLLTKKELQAKLEEWRFKLKDDFEINGEIKEASEKSPKRGRPRGSKQQ